MTMMMLSLLLTAAATVPDQIEVARASWTAYPRLDTEAVAVPNEEMITRVQRLMQRDECEFAGQNPRRFDIDVNYAVMLDSQGNAKRVIVEDVGCRPLELLVGRVASDLVARGFVLTPPPASPTWYASQINFNLQ
jgi:hypothetical protein